MRVRWLPRLLVLLTAANVRVASAQAADTNSLHEAAVFRQLQDAVRSSDTAAITRLFVYPSRVNRSQTSRFWVTSPAVLRRRLNEVLPDTIRRAILQQNPDSLFHNWRGSMVGNGEVWITNVCSDETGKNCRYGIAAINLPKARRSSHSRRHLTNP